MKSKIYFILSMVIFGTIGIFVRSIDLAASEIALLRGFVGSLFLLAMMIITRQKIFWRPIRENVAALLISSLALGGNWIFLFQSYLHTSIANATLSYYFAPVFVIILSPLVLKEKISLLKAACVGVAILGMFLIVRSSGASGPATNHLLGIIYGVIAAAFYATLMLANKFIKHINGMETTLLQLSLATIMLVPYVLLTGGMKILQATGISIPSLLIMGVIHTGMGFFFFFTGMKGLKAQSIAALSYIDPVTAMLVSFLILGEEIAALQIIGGAFLLGSTFISEIGKNHEPAAAVQE